MNVGALYREHGAELKRFLISLLRSREEADDVSQEAMVRLLKMADDAAVDRPRTLLFTIAYRIAIDRLRRRRRERTLFMGTPEDQESIAYERPLAERAVVAQQTVRLLSEAMGELKPLRREIILMNRVEEMSYQEISRRTGLTVNSIEKHVSRGLTACRAFVLAREAA